MLTQERARSATRTVYFPADAPDVPAVFAIVGNKDERVMRIGVTADFRRAVEHLFQRRIEETARIGEIRWWTHEDFHDPVVLAAAGLVAHDAFDRKHEKKRKDEAAWQLHQDQTFCIRIANLLSDEPDGRFLAPSFDQMAKRLSSVENNMLLLEKRLAALEKR